MTPSRSTSSTPLSRNPGSRRRASPCAAIPAAGSLRPGSVTFEGAGDLDESPLILPASAPARLPDIELDRGELEPGHYTGAMYLTLSGAEQRVALPLEINVKNGPFWAIVAILLALLFELGLRVRDRLAPRGAEISRLRRLKATLDSADLTFLGPRLKLAELQALHGETEDAATERNAIARDAQDLKTARAYEEEVRRVHKGTLPREVSLALQKLRIEASKPDNRGAINSALTDLRGLVHDAVTLGGVGLGVREIDSREQFNAPGPIVAAAGNVADRVRGSIRDFALRAGITALPGILAAILVIAFVLAGLKELYYANPTFGANPVLDYGSLFLWGVAASALRAALGWATRKEPETE